MKLCIEHQYDQGNECALCRLAAANLNLASMVKFTDEVKAECATARALVQDAAELFDDLGYGDPGLEHEGVAQWKARAAEPRGGR